LPVTVGAQQPGDGEGVRVGHAVEVGDDGHHQSGLQRHLQRGVEHLARRQVELASQLYHRGHAHPVHGASEQRAHRSGDLVTVDAHG
jgi:phosphatidylserine decarboxylase